MAENPYAKYVSPGNPYAKYTTPGEQGEQGGLGQYLSETAGNIGPSAMNLAKGLFVGLPVAAAKTAVQTVTHPLKTTADVSTALMKFVKNNFTLAPLDDDPIAKAVGGYVLKRYGSVEKIKQTFHDDPTGFLLDAASAITGVGGAARGVGGHLAASAAKPMVGGAAKIPTVNLALPSTRKAEKAAIQLDMAEGPRVRKAVNAAATLTPAVKAARTTKTAQKVSDVGKGVQTVGDAFNPILMPLNALRTAAKVPGLQGVSQVGLNALAAPGNLAGKVGDALANARDQKTAKINEYLGSKLPEVHNALGQKGTGGQVLDGSATAALPSHLTSDLVGSSVYIVQRPHVFAPDIYENAWKVLDSVPTSAAQGSAVVTGSTTGRNARAELVPGTKPNAAEAAAEAGSVGLAKLQEKVGRANTNVAQKTRDQGKANDKALLDYIGTFAKTRPDSTNAVVVRKAAFDSTYRVAKKGHAPGKHEELIGRFGTDHRLEVLMDRPAIKDAFATADKNAPNAGVRVFEEIPVSGFKSQKGAKAGKLTGEGVHRVKLALDAMIARAKAVESNPSVATELDRYNVADLTTAKKDFLAWAEKYIPEYGTARRGFRDASVPINQMEVGQYIQAELKKILDNKKLDASGRADAFAKVMADAPKILKNSMQESRFRRLDEVFDRSQLMKIQKVEDHLNRAKSVEVDATKAFDEKSSILSLNEGIPTSARGVLLHTVNQIMKLGKGSISERTAIEIAIGLRDSKAARDLLGDTLKKNESRKARAAAIKKVNATLKRTPVANALAPERDNENALAR